MQIQRKFSPAVLSAMRAIAKDYKDLINYTDTSFVNWLFYGPRTNCKLCRATSDPIKVFIEMRCGKCPCGPERLGCVRGLGKVTWVDLMQAINKACVASSNDSIAISKLKKAAEARWNYLQKVFDRKAPGWQGIKRNVKN